MPILHSVGSLLAPFTLPTFILANPIYSTLLPITAGTLIGYGLSPPRSDPARSARQYISLRRPPLNPPSWVFGPVWTTLYGMMGYAAHRVYLHGSTSLVPSVRDAAATGITLYSVSLIFNNIWTPLFFALNRPGIALVDILLLGTTVAATTMAYSEVDSVATYLMVPYLAWVGFATYLNAGTGYLNDWDVRDRDAKKKD
ncbi:TspO/MBR family-domain-containing protein [Peziza echinospora]|nr:TspO/MBR family-domain-containing protein [Peziza echinospora]